MVCRAVLLAVCSHILLLGAAFGGPSGSAVGSQEGHRALQSWPSFRGPNATGVADAIDLRASWSIGTGEGIRWVTPIPGYSHSSPIVWGDQVFVVTAISTSEAADGRRPGVGNVAIDDLAPREWRILSLDRRTGEVLWQRTADRGVPRVRRHEKASHANSTPATDGRFVAAVFNSQGLYCYDLGGRLLWQRDLGRLDPGYWGYPDRPWGHASSPILFNGLVIVQIDRVENSFLAAYRATDGHQEWRVDRDELATWSTPTVHGAGERNELIAQGGNYVRGYDPATGQELWRFADHAEVKVPTPFVAGDTIIATGGAPRGRPIFAIALGASGEIPLASEGSTLRWTIRSGGPYTSTPLAYQSILFVTRDSGILGAYDLKTGELLYRQRLGGGFSASPVAGDGKVFLTSEDGEVFVIKPGREFELIATNDMQETCFATPALSGDTIVLRTRTRLYGIGDEPEMRSAGAAVRALSPPHS